MSVDPIDLGAALRQIHTEAGGALSVAVVRQDDIAGLLAASCLGSPTATRVLRAATHSLAHIGKAPRRKPTLCACCPRAIRRNDRFALAIAFPFRADPTRALGMAVCAGCDDGGDLQEQAATGLRRIWPDLRTVVISDHIGGTA